MTKIEKYVKHESNGILKTGSNTVKNCESDQVKHDESIPVKISESNKFKNGGQRITSEADGGTSEVYLAEQWVDY